MEPTFWSQVSCEEGLSALKTLGKLVLYQAQLYLQGLVRKFWKVLLSPLLFISLFRLFILLQASEDVGKLHLASKGHCHFFFQSFVEQAHVLWWPSGGQIMASECQSLSFTCLNRAHIVTSYIHRVAGSWISSYLHVSNTHLPAGMPEREATLLALPAQLLRLPQTPFSHRALSLNKYLFTELHAIFHSSTWHIIPNFSDKTSIRELDPLSLGYVCWRGSPGSQMCRVLQE